MLVGERLSQLGISVEGKSGADLAREVERKIAPGSGKSDLYALSASLQTWDGASPLAELTYAPSANTPRVVGDGMVDFGALHAQFDEPGAERDLSIVTGINEYLTPQLEAFQDGDRLILSMIVDPIYDSEIRGMLTEAGFRFAPDEHPYYLENAQMKSKRDSAIATRYLVGMREGATLDAFLQFLQSHQQSEKHLGNVRLGLLVHSRDDVDVAAD